MGKIKYTKGIGLPTTTFDDVFLTHKKNGEWWYCTGYLKNESGGLFGYQFTLAKVRFFGIGFNMLICSVTDIKNQKHYNIQLPIFFKKGITTNETLLEVKDSARVEFSPNEFSSKGKMKLHIESGDFCLDVDLDALKAPVWHCDNGVLQMGIQNDEKQRTYYYSFTNIASKGTLTINGQTHNNLVGKSWFDRQGGTYSLANRKCQWEWFSLRFFDDAEAMLFSFPHMNYYDGTYIERDGQYRRMNDYKVAAAKVVTAHNGWQFSSEWNLEMNGKKYKIIPKIDGMINLFFFELLASIIDENGKEVGYAFVELLPGVRNKSSALNAFKKKK
jgi:hypothetical protein